MLKRKQTEKRSRGSSKNNHTTLRKQGCFPRPLKLLSVRPLAAYIRDLSGETWLLASLTVVLSVHPRVTEYSPESRAEGCLQRNLHVVWRRWCITRSITICIYILEMSIMLSEATTSSLTVALQFIPKLVSRWLCRSKSKLGCSDLHNAQRYCRWNVNVWEVKNTRGPSVSVHEPMMSLVTASRGD